jgi:hypothetical protein
VRDVEGELTVEQVADDLSALADATARLVVRWAWARLRQRHRDEPGLAVIAYGKLGGKELGYGSDLDVVFLYDDSDEPDKDRAQEVYGAFVRKLITWLTLRTAAGELFDIDTALRPNGNSGPAGDVDRRLRAYQAGRGSNTAWTWEHQAMTRARCVRRHARCAGPLRGHAPRGADRAARPSACAKRSAPCASGCARRPPGAGRRFDVKHSAGGMMDVEFAVQYLVLAHRPRHPALLDNAGNIALLQRAEAAGLLPAGVGQAAADAYRELRRAQHRARLDEQPTQFDINWQPPLAFSEPWRSVTAAWVHLSPLHLAGNLAATAVVALLGRAAGCGRRAAVAWALAWPLTQALLAEPALLRYGGLSGVLHAGAAVAAVALSAPAPRRGRHAASPGRRARRLRRRSPAPPAGPRRAGRRRRRRRSRPAARRWPPGAGTAGVGRARCRNAGSGCPSGSPVPARWTGAAGANRCCRFRTSTAHRRWRRPARCRAARPGATAGRCPGHARWPAG